MNDIYFNNKHEVNEFTNKLAYIGSGTEGTCYKFSDKITFKYLCGESYIPKSKSQLLQFKDIKISNFSFVHNLAYLKEEIIGVFSPYIKGRVISRGLYDVDFLSLIKAFEDLENSIWKLSGFRVNIYDATPPNIIYNNDKFYLIDTIEYEESDLSIEKLYVDNMINLLMNCYDLIFNNTILNFIDNIKEIKDFKKNEELIIKPIYILKILLIKLNEYSGCSVKNANHATKILLK